MSTSPPTIGTESPVQQARRASYVAWLAARGVEPKDIRVTHQAD